MITVNKSALQTEPQKLPAGWLWVRLGDVCDAIRGVTFSSGEAKPTPFEGSIACLTTSGVQAEVNWNSRRYIPKTRMGSQEQILYVNDLLVSTANSKALVGKSCLVSEMPFPCTFGAFVTVLRPKPLINPSLLASWMRSPQVMEFCYLTSSNTTNISNLRVSDLLTLEIPLPPLAEQERIAVILKEQISAVQKAKDATEAQLEAAKKLPTTYLGSIFNSVEASSCPTKKLGQILKLRKEIIHPHDKPEGPATFVGLEHIESLTGKRIGALEVEMSKLTGRKPRFFAGDIVYGYLRPYLNKVWIAEFDGLCSVDQYVYSVDRKQALVEFVAWFMRSPVYLARAPIDTTPGQLPRIRTEEVAAVEINLPEIEEQNRVVRLIEARMSAIQRIHQSLETQLESINMLSAALLRCAFNGEL